MAVGGTGSFSEKEVHGILSAAILEDYSVWLFFAHYNRAPSYIIWAATEAFRLACLFLVTCCLIREKFLSAAFSCFAVKLLLDLSAALSRFDYNLRTISSTSIPIQIFFIYGCIY